MEDNNIPTNDSTEPNLEVIKEEITAVKEEPTAPVAPSEPAKDEVVFADKPKKNNGMALGMIFFAILAIAGIAFGAWAMIEKENTSKALNDQIKSLESKNAELQAQIDDIEGIIDDETYEILPPKWGEAEAAVEDGVFIIKNKDGDIYTELDEYVVTEIVSCESGTEDAPAPMTCVVNTPDGEAKIIYNFDEQSLEYIGTTE